MNIPLKTLISIFTKTKELVCQNTNLPMCYALNKAIKLESCYNNYDFLRIGAIKEYLIDTYLLKFKPSNLSKNDCWFNYDTIGHLTRIKILNEVLSKLEHEDYHIELADDYRTENDFFPRGTVLIENWDGYVLIHLGKKKQFTIKEIDQNTTGLFKKLKKHKKQLNINIGYIMGSEITPKCVEDLLNKEFNIECKVIKLN